MGSGSNTATEIVMADCGSRNNGRHGYFFNGQQTRVATFINCRSELNGGFGYEAKGAQQDQVMLVSCSDYSSTSGAYNTAHIVSVQNFLTLSVDPAVSSSNFALNNSNPGGAQLRAAREPATLPNGIANDFGDRGGIQHQDAGGGTFIAPGPFIFGRGTQF
jgi:hypothetical protein